MPEPSQIPVPRPVPPPALLAVPTGAAPSTELALNESNFQSGVLVTAAVCDELVAEHARQIQSGLDRLIDWRRSISISSLALHYGHSSIPSETWEALGMPSLIGHIALCSEDKAYIRTHFAENFEVASIFRDSPASGLDILALTQSFSKLPTSPGEISARQQAVKELSENPKLAAQFESMLSDSIVESAVSLLAGPSNRLQDRFVPLTIRAWYNRNRRALDRFKSDLEKISEPQSPLLRSAVTQLRTFADSELSRLHTNGARFTPRGLEPADTKGGLLSMNFHPLALHPVRSFPLYIPAALAATGVVMLLGSTEMSAASLRVLTAAGIASVGALAYTAAGGVALKYAFVDEFVAKAQTQVPPLLGATALIREFLALNRFAESSTHPSSFMRLVPSDGAYFSAQDMGSPLHAEQETWVYNAASVVDAAPTIIMGPNSGGKTSWLKDVFSNWLLAQVGGRSFVREGSFSPATRFILSVPKQNNHESTQGRFGEEIQWLRPELDRGLNSCSVVAFDEIGSGTSEGASAPIGVDILEVLAAHECRVLVATHNYPLKDALASAGIMVNPLHPEVLLVGYPDGSQEADSTHRILPGFPSEKIPPELGARRVMSELGLSPRDLAGFKARALEKRGKARPS